MEQMRVSEAHERLHKIVQKYVRVDMKQDAEETSLAEKGKKLFSHDRRTEERKGILERSQVLM